MNPGKEEEKAPPPPSISPFPGGRGTELTRDEKKRRRVRGRRKVNGTGVFPFLPPPISLSPPRGEKKRALERKKDLLSFHPSLARQEGGEEDEGGGPRIDVRPYSAIVSLLKVGNHRQPAAARP